MIKHSCVFVWCALNLYFTVCSGAGATPSVDAVNRESVVRVRSSEVGTGFIIMTDGRQIYLLTAGHVVSGRDPVPPPCSVDFGDRNLTLPCEILDVYGAKDGADLAVLRVDATKARGVFYASRLGEVGQLPATGAKVYTFGYPRGGSLRRMDGSLAGATGLRVALNGIAPEQGQSGSPLYSADDGSVIGMIIDRAVGSEEQTAIEIDVVKLLLRQQIIFRSFVEVVRPPAGAVGPLVTSDFGPTMTSMFASAASPARWYERSKRYSRTDYDFPLILDNTWLGIRRTYVSGSDDRIGLFGRGWLTPLEYEVDLEHSSLCRIYIWNAQNIRVALDTVSDCAEAKRTLEPQVSEPQVLNRSLGELLRKPDLAERVLPDGGPSYVGADFSVVRARYVAGGIELTIGDSNFVFNNRGKMREIRSQGRSLEIEYDTGNRAAIIQDGSRYQQFVYDGQGRVSRVRFSDGTQYEYAYDDRGNLVSVSATGKPRYRYRYDAKDRLVFAHCEGDKHGPSLVSYGEDGARVSVKREGLEYLWSFQDNDSGLPKVEQQLIKPGSSEFRSYLFDYEDKKLVLKSEQGDMTYVLTKCLCLPLEVRSKNEIWRYEYDVFGRVVGMKLPVGEVHQGYDDRVNKINTVEFRNGSERKQMAVAAYDEFGNLVRIRSTDLVSVVSSWSHLKELDHDGDDKDKYEYLSSKLASAGNIDDDNNLSLSYDDNGRITVISDEKNGKIIRVEYNLNGKPTRVETPGAGFITVTYKKSGEIEKVDSKDGPNVAIQIASTFNNLLDAISPFENVIVPDTDFDLLTAEPYGCRECSRATPF